MKARYLTLLVSVVVTVVMTVTMMFVARRIVFNHFAALEQRHLEEDIDRAVRLLNSELQNLNQTAKDYATWDDTYEFMRRRKQAYLRSNFGAISFDNLKLRTLMLLDTKGHTVYQTSWERNVPRTELDIDIEKIKTAAKVLRARPSAQAITGIISLSDGPVLASVRPIITTHEQGPSRGTLIMVRDLDYRLLGRVSSLGDFPLAIKRSQVSASVNEHVIGDGIRRRGGSRITVLNEDQLSVKVTLTDWFGHPAYQLELLHDRDSWHQGQHAQRFLMYSIVIFGFVFGALVLLLVQLVYVRRVKTLVRFTEQIKNEEGLKSRICFRWKDELSHLADQINQMLEDLQNSHEKLALARERLQHEATHDSLTGTWNCAAALELLDREISRSEREENTVGVLMLDIDHFKNINDRFGHAAGDRALQAIAASIGGILRTTDILARYGGEEFLVIAPGCNLIEGRRLAERILFRLQSTPTPIGDERVQITVSIGLVAGSFPFSSEELIGLADRALYQAKANGRNRFEIEEAVPNRVKGMLYAMPRRNV